MLPQPDLAPVPMSQVPGGGKEMGFPASPFRIEQPQSPLRTDLEEVLKLTRDAAELKVNEGAKAAGAFVGELSEPEVIRGLENQELKYIADAYQADKAKANGDGKKLTEAEAKHLMLVEVYESASFDGYLGHLNKITSAAGLPEMSMDYNVSVPEAFKDTQFLDNPELRKHLLQELDTELGKLVHDTHKRETALSLFGDVMENIAAAKDQFMGTGDTREIYRLLRFQMLSDVHQERESAKVMLGDHGFGHSLGWDARIALKLAEEMKLSPLSKTRIFFAAANHDKGYALSKVVEINKTKFGAERNHGVHAARIYREALQKGLFNGLYGNDIESINSIFGAELNHDNFRHVDLKDKRDLPAIEKSLLVAADLTAVWEDKMPPAVATAPEIMLPAMYKIKVAAENLWVKNAKGERVFDEKGFAEALTRIKVDASAQLDSSTDIHSDDKQSIAIVIDHLSALDPKFVPGRLTTLVDTKESWYDATSNRLCFAFRTVDEEGIGALFGRGASKDQIIKLYTECGLPADKVDDALTKPFVDVGDHFRIYRQTGKVESIEGETEFHKSAREVLTTLRQENQEYLRVNEVLKDIKVGETHPQSLIARLTDPNTVFSDLYLEKLKVAGGSHFFRDGKWVEKNDIIAELRTTEGMGNFEDSLYQTRAEVAKNILNKK